MHDYTKHPNVQRAITQETRALGFTPVFVTTQVDGVTHKVRSKLRSCIAFLQILSLRPGEDPERAQFTWLDFEYGMAFALERTRLRAVDVSVMDGPWWRNRIDTDRDRPLAVVDFGSEDDVLAKQVSSILGELTSRI